MLSAILQLIVASFGTFNPSTNLPQSLPYFGKTQEQIPHISAPNAKESQHFQRVINRAKGESISEKPMGEIMQNIALDFLGSAYKAGLLDKTQQEELFISLLQFDCVLFVETVLALSRNIVLHQYQYQDLAKQITNLRYRSGKIDGYCSRLHYFSDWIDDNQKRGHVQDITQQLGGISLNKTLNFMSNNRQSYQQLKTNNINYQCIKEVEANLQQSSLTYIPTNKIKNIYPHLQPGDIIGVVTNIAGLDTTHTGLVYRQGKQTGLIHASPAGSVTIAPDLEKYISNVDRAIGIFIVRPLKPN
jgi:hypothetical protein